MKAITTRYRGPSATQAARFRASDMDGNAVTVSAETVGGLGEPGHQAAAHALLVKMGWTGRLVGGYVAPMQMTWVFLPVEDRSELLKVIGVLVGALDDASSVVDKGEDEAYAYEAELELGRSVLARAEATS